MWLVAQATGELADPIDRDLRTDRLHFDDLGWRGLWAYITTAPPGTAIFHARTQGWTISDKISAETLTDLRKLIWRYIAMHFKGGVDEPFPDPIDYPGRGTPTQSVKGWADVSIDELITPEVRKLLQGA